MRTLLTSWMIALTAFGIGCAPATPAHKDLEAQRAMFAQAALPSYQLIWQQSCDCEADATRSIAVTVTGNEIVSATYLDDHQPVSASVRGRLRTIDGVFDLISDRLDDADQVDVTYDARVHYPSFVKVKIYKTAASDGDMTLSLFNFVTPVKPADTGKPALRATLATQRAMFVEPASYSFTWDLSCFCDPETNLPVRVSVTHGAITRAVYRDNQQPVSARVLASLKTPPALFDIIANELADNSGWRSEDLTFEYDPVLHVPTRVRESGGETSDLQILDFVVPSDDARAISAARARWTEHRPSSYSYDWQRSCFCDRDVTRPIHVSVTGDQITSASFADDHVAIADPASLSVLTVDGVFAALQARLDEGGNGFTLTFDPTLGYPSSVYVKGIHGPEDGEFAVTISKLVRDTP